MLEYIIGDVCVCFFLNRLLFTRVHHLLDLYPRNSTRCDNVTFESSARSAITKKSRIFCMQG